MGIKRRGGSILQMHVYICVFKGAAGAVLQIYSPAGLSCRSLELYSFMNYTAADYVT